MRVSSPGKLVIAGEYAVLEGAPALVAAVDRRAVARWVPGSQAGTDGSAGARGGSRETPVLPAEALVARRMAEEVCGVVPQELQLSVTALRQDGRKLGLGSSAAGAAAAAGAVFAWHGHEVSATAVRSQVLAAAMAGHRQVAPEGSGVDVAASVLGGFVRFRRTGDDFEAEPVTWPDGLEVRVVWTGAEARTSDLVARVRDLARSAPDVYRGRIDAVREAAAGFLRAVSEGRSGDAVRAADAHHEAMAALGEAAGAPIVEERLAQIAGLARAAGGAAKPSGAGGGDVAVAFFTGAAETARFEAACRGAGLSLLDLGVGAEGTAASA